LPKCSAAGSKSNKYSCQSVRQPAANQINTVAKVFGSRRKSNKNGCPSVRQPAQIKSIRLPKCSAAGANQINTVAKVFGSRWQNKKTQPIFTFNFLKTNFVFAGWSGLILQNSDHSFCIIF